MLTHLTLTALCLDFNILIFVLCTISHQNVKQTVSQAQLFLPDPTLFGLNRPCFQGPKNGKYENKLAFIRLYIKWKNGLCVHKCVHVCQWTLTFDNTILTDNDNV